MMLKHLLIITVLVCAAGSGYSSVGELGGSRALNGSVPQTPCERVAQFGGSVFSGEVFRGTFTPDGNTFYFFKKIKSGTEDYRIFSSRLVAGKWTKPEKVLLGGEHSDLYPSVSKDGRRLVFASYRPVPGSDLEKPNAHLWYVDKTEKGWGDPVFMKKANRLGYYHAWVEFGWNGDIFFRQTTPDWKSRTTLVTSWNGREYSTPRGFEPVIQLQKKNPGLRIVGGSPGPTKDLIFLDVATTNPKTGRGASDIWISRRIGEAWQKPQPLTAVNTDGFDVFPFFSPGGKCMYFVRDFKAFYRVDLESALKQ